MKQEQVLETAKHYFSDYFGQEYKEIIGERLDDCKLYVVSPQLFKKKARHFIKDTNAILESTGGDKLHPTVNDGIIGIARHVARYKEKTAGMSICLTRGRTPKLSMLNKGIFICDFKKSKYDGAPYFDQVALHELLHVATSHIKDGHHFYGVRMINDDINELLVDSIAIKVARKMHKDGVCLNEDIGTNRAKYMSAIVHKRFPKLSHQLVRGNLLKDKKHEIDSALLCGDNLEFIDQLEI